MIQIIQKILVLEMRTEENGHIRLAVQGFVVLPRLHCTAQQTAPKGLNGTSFPQKH